MLLTYHPSELTPIKDIWKRLKSRFPFECTWTNAYGIRMKKHLQITLLMSLLTWLATSLNLWSTMMKSLWSGLRWASCQRPWTSAWSIQEGRLKVACKAWKMKRKTKEISRIFKVTIKKRRHRTVGAPLRANLTVSLWVNSVTQNQHKVSTRYLIKLINTF